MTEQASFQSGANLNSLGPANLRQRPLGRATTFSEATTTPSKFNRRNSAISDTVSEARQSIRDSTDELLFPRAKATVSPRLAEAHHDSHWQSAPLALALLPAVGGLFFNNGSAFVTDATLLILAAVFLNWSVRLPWNWYRSAQEIRRPLPDTLHGDDGTIVEEDDGERDEGDKTTKKSTERRSIEQANQSAIKELHIHELAALISCFVFPLIGAWLLHGIRGALSRPSEGLVSNYNLTIFLLAAEIRPFAHLLQMVQGRTLYLQRVVAEAADEEDEDREIDHNKILDLAARLEDLEAYVADNAATKKGSNSNSKQATTGETLKPELLSQIINEVRHSIQPEMDALNRAIRRYEKKTALMAFQTETRMNQIEAQVGDAIALAAAAQRSAADNRQSFVFALLDWMAAVVVVPVRVLMQLFSLPGKMASFCVQEATLLVLGGGKRRLTKINKGKQMQKPSTMTEKRYLGGSSQSAVVSGIRPVKKET
ncbi:conserved hypothetical protein [Talaromyces stipitatus ATCC 10500]|uniref:Uncharacterized protein n=1 Tax=Talaromyces stipitatus (strain ATCC 10500 / CBS 375.48 / QM 6759 / NRRL 1006) TaxID=441959 RepID=B8MQ11_TALSN|nr:uncharacterized protein TSTA_054130 [Talaromyces stipitatus ATCC 10500]EED12901.1 conserved hypothetical protein [Talaromyces stipitatus ATCC 10500]